MKTGRLFLLLGFVTLSLTHCKKSDVDPPSRSGCKLTAIDRGNGNTHRYEYNAAGFVSKATYTFQGSTGSNDRHVYVYSFSYNGQNQVTGATITLNGKTPDQVTDWGVGSGIACQWTNGQLTEVKDLLGTQTVTTTTIRYDAQGRITRFLLEPTDQNVAQIDKKFSYDTDGNITYQYLEDGKPYYSESHVYDKTTLSTESLLAQRGLPFDFFNVNVWKTNNLKGFESDEFDDAGKVTAHRSYRITNVVKNASNMAVSQTIEEGNTKRVNTFTLADCE